MPVDQSKREAGKRPFSSQVVRKGQRETSNWDAKQNFTVYPNDSAYNPSTAASKTIVAVTALRRR